MDDKDFELLLLLDQTKNITKTADLLYMTQSALSKRIQSLEKEFGTSLFIRQHRGIQFTAEGEQVLECIRQITQTLEHTKSTIRYQHGQLSGTLQIGVNTSYLSHHMPSIIAQYHAQNPNVNLYLIEGHSRKLYQGLIEGMFDMAIIRGDYAYSGNKIILEQERLCLAHSHEFDGRALSDICFIGNKPVATYEGKMARWLHENNIHITNGHIYSQNFFLGLELLKMGVGWTILPQSLLDNYDGYIQPLSFANGEPFTRATCLLYSGSTSLLPQAEAFIQLLMSRYQLPVRQ